MNQRQTLKALIASGAAAAVIAGAMIDPAEGLVHIPYRDPAGIVTVCRGHTGPDIIWDKYYTYSECAVLKAKDVAKAEAEVDRYVKVPLTPYQKAALIDFAFNKGPGNLRTSTLLRKTNARDYNGACLEYRKWVKARVHGILTILRGLVTRAQTDEWVCLGGK